MEKGFQVLRNSENQLLNLVLVWKPTKMPKLQKVITMHVKARKISQLWSQEKIETLERRFHKASKPWISMWNEHIFSTTQELFSR